MDQDKLRVSVIGVGHLGKAHARILSTLPGARLVSVADIKEEAAREQGEKYGVPWTTDFREIPGEPQAVCVVVPTKEHFRVASWFLEKGVHVLVEKPMAGTLEEADRLIELARERGLTLQVGHVERFNPVLAAVREMGIRPRYMEAQRVAPFTFRSVDVGVVQDLMIHDLDIIFSLTGGGEVVDVEAFGGSVFTDKEDLATARLIFSTGEVAHLTTSRVALHPDRKFRLFAEDSYVSMDFGKKYGILIKKGPGWDRGKLDLSKIDPSRIEDLWKFVYEGLLTVKEIKAKDAEPLKEELLDFVRCVKTGEEPLVTGAQGRRALKVAFDIEKALRAHPW